MTLNARFIAWRTFVAGFGFDHTHRCSQRGWRESGLEGLAPSMWTADALFLCGSWVSCCFRRRQEKEREGKVHKVASRLYFTNMGSRPRWIDFHKNCQGCSSPWRNHSLQVWLQYFQGFQIYRGVKISIFPLTLLVIVTTVLTLLRSLWCNCILPYACRTGMLLFPITYVQYAYVITEGNAWSHLIQPNPTTPDPRVRQTRMPDINHIVWFDKHWNVHETSLYKHSVKCSHETMNTELQRVESACTVKD